MSVSEIHATSMTLWLVENKIAMKRSQGVGSIANTIKRIIIRIDTDSGISGYGEAAPWAVFSGTTEAGVAVLANYFWPEVKGQKVADIPKIMKACDRAAVGHPEAKAAIEMALYDIVGKASDLPIYQLLGGKVKDKIPFSFSIANPDLEADLELTSRMYEEGSRIFKIKTGFVEDHDEDVRRVARIREHLPDDTDLRIDYNQGLPAFGALQKLKQMEEFRPTFLEQPVKAHLWDVMADLTANLVTPILADESVFNAASASDAVQRKIAKAFSIKIMKAGGLANGRAIASIAEQAGIPCYGGTLFEGAIALNAAAHFIVATENMSLGCEFYMPRYVMSPDELEASVDIRDGYVYPPEGPGLGLTIDEDAINRTSIETLKL
nr:enolase C-terminal domain-like protein [uncultured Cohaesibacter sp.]